MADCTCVPEYLLATATRNLSTREERRHFDKLWSFTSNPFEQGRKNQEAVWRRDDEEHARRLIWC